MLFSFVVKDHWDAIVHLVVVCHYQQVVLDNMVLPNLYNFLEESFGARKITHLLEELAHVVVALAKVDRLGTMFSALLVNATRQLFDCLFAAISSVLGHKQPAKCDIEGGMVPVELFFCYSCVLATCSSIIS